MVKTDSEWHQYIGIEYVANRRGWVITFNGKVKGDSRAYGLRDAALREAQLLVARDPEYRTLDV